MDGQHHRVGNTVPGRRWWQRRWFQVIAVLTVLAGGGLLVAVEYVLHHAEPIIRKRIIEALSQRFDAPVELDRVSLSLGRGIVVNGYGLRIPFGAGAPPPAPPYPLVAVRHFAFRTTVHGLLRDPTHLASVEVEGMELHIPPPAQRGALLGTREGLKPADPDNPRLRPKIALVVNQLHCEDVRLSIESGKPGKDPLVFQISTLEMRNVGRKQAMLYDAVLTNATPRGLIHAQGHFGPWAGEAAGRHPKTNQLPDPGQTPIDGDYTFEHADLNTIKGIGGTLSSRGHFAGVLDRLSVQGVADVPDFSLDISNRPVPLHAAFHAIVDGTDGDTFLQPVQARLEQSNFTTSGQVVNIKGQGHDIQLDVAIPHGRMQDFLRLAVKTDPPILDGTLTMHAKLHIPPGKVRVPLKMAMEGSFQLAGVEFTNKRWQDKLDGLSARASGHPGEVAEVSHDRTTEIHSQMEANFTIAHGLLTVTDVNYQLPGAQVLLNGVYSIDGKLFEFKGHVRTQATASQMVTGWKSLLLKPVDPFLRKNGAGLELPVEISGTGGDLHFGLAVHGADDTPAEMLSEIRDKDGRKREIGKARAEAAAADTDDRAAAAAPTLEAAERAHRAAVQRRAQAQAQAQAAKRTPGTPE